MKKLDLKSQKGVRQNVGKNKVYGDLEKVDQRMTADKMAKIAQKKIEGKELVAHPTLKNTFIYK